MESVEKGPVRKKADALVGVDRHRVLSPRATGLKTQLCALSLSQTLFGVHLIKLDRCTINLDMQDMLIN